MRGKLFAHLLLRTDLCHALWLLNPRGQTRQQGRIAARASFGKRTEIASGVVSARVNADAASRCKGGDVAIATIVRHQLPSTSSASSATSGVAVSRRDSSQK